MINVEFQNVSAAQIPDEPDLYRWIVVAIQREEAEIVVRIVDLEESTELNQMYRHQNKPTNVLSFPFEAPPGIASNILGDLVICAPIVEIEAKEQGKSIPAHWAHLLIHGVLHLQGFDHMDEKEAFIMESKEINLLNELGFANPYAEANIS